MFWYLGTPYSKWPFGMEDAYLVACRQTAFLMTAGVRVYSPIAHMHSVACHGGIDLRHDFDGGTVDWLAADAPFMEAARGMIVCKMQGWETSRGVLHEIDVFRTAGKPIIYMTPGEVPATLL